MSIVFIAVAEIFHRLGTKYIYINRAFQEFFLVIYFGNDSLLALHSAKKMKDGFKYFCKEFWESVMQLSWDVVRKVTVLEMSSFHPKQLLQVSFIFQSKLLPSITEANVAISVNDKMFF